MQLHIVKQIRKWKTNLMGKIVIDGKTVYEIDEECIRKREQKEQIQKQQEKDRKPTQKRNESEDIHRIND